MHQLADLLPDLLDFLLKSRSIIELFLQIFDGDHRSADLPHPFQNLLKLFLGFHEVVLIITLGLRLKQEK